MVHTTIMIKLSAIRPDWRLKTCLATQVLISATGLINALGPA